MNLRDLQYLVSVADLSHFGAAAKRCHISQPTLSMQIKKLEEGLGVAIFERDRKQVKITQIGEKIIERARRMLLEEKEIREIAKTAQDPFKGEFRLGAFPTLAPYFLPTAVPKVMEQFPDLKLLLVEEKTQDLLDRLQTGTLDAALIALPVAEEGLESAPLFEDPFMLAVPEKHKLAGKKYVTRHDLRGEQLLLLEEGHCLRSQALSVCSLVGNSKQQDFRATSLETLRQMVATGVGMTLIPKLAVREHDGIVYIPFQGAEMFRTIGLVWRKTSSRLPVTERLVQVLKG